MGHTGPNLLPRRPEGYNTSNPRVQTLSDNIMINRTNKTEQSFASNDQPMVSYVTSYCLLRYVVYKHRLVMICNELSEKNYFWSLSKLHDCIRDAVCGNVATVTSYWIR